MSLQPEEYGQEAMEGQGEAMLDPEGETYDETLRLTMGAKVETLWRSMAGAKAEAL